jgi:hypothetical protein
MPLGVRINSWKQVMSPVSSCGAESVRLSKSCGERGVQMRASIEPATTTAIVEPRFMCYITRAPRLRDFINQRRIPSGHAAIAVLR